MTNVQVEISWNVDDRHVYTVVVDTGASYSPLPSPESYAATAVQYLIQNLRLVGVDWHEVDFRVGRVFYRDSSTSPMHIVG